MPKYNNHIFIYEPIKKPIPGGLSSRIIIIKGKKGQYFIDTATIGKKINQKKREEMITDGIVLYDTLGFLPTHFHPDHIRGVSFWKNHVKENIPLFTHPDSKRFIENPGMYGDLVIDLLGDMYRNVVPFSPKISKKVTNWLWGPDPNYEIIKTINDGQEFDLGDVIIKAIYTPGHSPDHIAYRIIINDNDKKYLVSGDLLSLKDMKDGNGEIGLASFNNPLSSLRDELKSLQKILEFSPDVLITQHYGTFEDKEEIERYLKQAIEEGNYLHSKTIDVLSDVGDVGIEFKRLTKKVIDFPKYLSGIATRTNSMWVLLKELIEDGIVERIENTTKFRLV